MIWGTLSRCFVLAEWVGLRPGAVECRSLRVCVCGIVFGLDEQLNALTIGENEGLRPRSGIEGVARKTAPRLTRPWALSQWTQSLPRTRMRPC